jgi:hypothetical protein
MLDAQAEVGEDSRRKPDFAGKLTKLTLRRG